MNKNSYLKIIYFSLILLSFFPLLSATQISTNKEYIPSLHETYSIYYKVEPGIYHNDSKYILFNNEENISESLKFFNRFYYDKVVNFEKDEEPMLLSQVDNKIYLNFWLKTESDFWIPAGNMTELTLNPARRLDKLTGYQMIQDSKKVYAVDYWLIDNDYPTQEILNNKVALLIDESNNFEASIPKYIKLGTKVYTCTVGKGKKIRNGVLLDQLPFSFLTSNDGMLMVKAIPYLEKLEETDINKIIDSHNNIIYPPRFWIAVIKEPYIYSLMESLSIKDLPINNTSPLR